MANVFVSLPLPALNGAGAAVDTSAMGATKTFIVTGSFPGAAIIIEASTDGGTVYAPALVFQDGDREFTLNVVADHMRARVSGRKTSVPFSAVVEAGAPGDTPLFTAIAMPALNGPGASVDISAFPDFSTFIAGGSFQGATVIVDAATSSQSWPSVDFCNVSVAPVAVATIAV